jgi:hypothetical protein
MKLREFIWRPSQGIDAAALARLAEHFPCPKAPMGEAWFMGETRDLYSDLMGDLDELPAESFRKPLYEIGSGYSAFGPMDEWHDWYHYLLPRTLPRALDGTLSTSLVESLVTGFMAIYPNGVYSAPYKSFGEDVLLTLGRCLMQANCWDGDQIVVGELLHRDNNNPARVWCWWDVSGDFGSSMLFCLKYLPEELVAGWLRSVLAIPSPHWRAQVIVWAVGMSDMLADRIRWPSEWNVSADLKMSWEGAWCLRSELATQDKSGATPMMSLLPAAARESALHVFKAHFSEDVFLDWIESIDEVDYLRNELGQIPVTFENLYVHSSTR